MLALANSNRVEATPGVQSMRSYQVPFDKVKATLTQKERTLENAHRAGLVLLQIKLHVALVHATESGVQGLRLRPGSTWRGIALNFSTAAALCAEIRLLYYSEGYRMLQFVSKDVKSK